METLSEGDFRAPGEPVGIGRASAWLEATWSEADGDRRSPPTKSARERALKERLKRSFLGILLLLVLAGFCAPLGAQENGRNARSPQETEALYQQVGDQLFCICGCREKLLECSHNQCDAKEAEREFLKELCRDAGLDEAAIKAAMAKRFGPEVLQVPDETMLWPILGVVGVLLLGAFAVGAWLLSSKRKAPAGLVATSSAGADNDELKRRIERELSEMD